MDKKEINRLIAEKIMGWEAYSDDFNPIENIADAWKVVDKLLLTVSRNFDGYEVFHANASSSGRGNQYIGTTNNQEWVEHESAPMAICIYALKKVGVALSQVAE